MKNEEIWKDILGYEGLYQVSDIGNVKRIRKKKVCKRSLLMKGELQGGYVRVQLSKDNIGRKFLAHRLVAEAFVPNPDNKPEVNHKNGNKADNRANNLEWATRVENNAHAVRTGLWTPAFGTSISTCKLTEAEVLQIRASYIQNVIGYKALAKRYNVDPKNIYNIIKGVSWKNLKTNIC